MVEVLRTVSASDAARLLAAALAELSRADEHDTRGVILLGADHEVDFASPPALRLLREFFPAEPSARVPAEIAEWLDGGAAERLIRRHGVRRLIIERNANSLVFQEQHDTGRLTERECDVLSWVARGKTNAEIAELLRLAPSTVRKHLENVYAKLGVSTRTAAVARFLGLIDARAS
jgi:DNA-binding CsgD family transcriptional regulator